MIITVQIKLKIKKINTCIVLTTNIYNLYVRN
jgi:hypothetical protein